MSNIVFIATSLDGYIAGVNNEIDWLHAIPNPDNIDMGFNDHMNNIDAIIMGRNTFELVDNMDCDWPYSKPVFVLTNTLNSVKDELRDKVFLVNGAIQDVLSQIKDKGYEELYIDGGLTIQSFLKEDLIDDMIITTIPILLGDGISLFGKLNKSIEYRCVRSQNYANGICQNHFKRFDK